jgi:hypothetical protein
MPFLIVSSSFSIKNQMAYPLLTLPFQLTQRKTLLSTLLDEFVPCRLWTKKKTQASHPTRGADGAAESFFQKNIKEEVIKEELSLLRACQAFQSVQLQKDCRFQKANDKINV